MKSPSKKIIFLADAFLHQVLGGGEICNHCVINFLSKNYSVEKYNTYNFSLNDVKANKNNFFIIGNFSLLHNNIISYITDNCNYVIYEHDYKFDQNRNPAKYINFLLPPNKIIFKQFYAKAKKILCQTNFQKDIFFKNLNLDNIISLSDNFWLDEHYDLLEKMSDKTKKDCTAIIDYKIDHKNTEGAIEYCKKNFLQYDLISDINYSNFLQKLGSYKTFIFIPKTPETFSRTVAEARMMNVDVITNNLIGCKKEDWYNKYKGKELIKFIKNKNLESYKIFEDLICIQ